MKKTKIYLIVTILVFLLSIVLVACGDKPSQDTPTEQEKKYTVTFVVDGEDYFTLETSGKSAIELPSNPTKDGYEFVGWYFDVNVWLNPCNSTSFANENLTANVTVYARWEQIKETYSVTFVGGTGATGDAPTMEAKAEGDKFDLPQNTFVKEDYDFDGWFDGQTKYVAGDEYVMPSYAVTFTAQWVLTPKYKVTFVGGEGAVGTDPEIEDKKEGEVITLPENSYTKEDYIFAGWSDGEKTYLAAATYTMPKKDVEFVAVWEYSKYIVSFDSRGGSDVEAAKVDKNGKLTAPKQPKRNGYLFSGWYKNEDCTTLWDFDVDKVKGNITLYAKWVVDAVGISSVEGATIDGNNILMVIEKDVEFVELAEKVILANTNAYWNLYYDRLGQTKIPTKIAANQTDGSLDSAENVFYILVTSENGLQEKLYTLTIYRRFTVNVKYYDKDNNLIVDKDDATLTSYQMDTFNTINVAYDKYSVIGYSFDGWDIIVDGERVPFVFGENGTNVLSNVNLYAHVTPLQYVATFTLGDGETLDVTSQTMTYDAQYTLPVPQKTGYTFKGWYYEKSYDYIYLSDGNGASSSVWTVAQDVELKADWSVNYYTVSIEKNYDDAGTVSKGGSLRYNSDFTISVQSINLGYTFVGWYDGETLLTTENAYTFKVPANDRTFVAKWEVNEEMQPFEFTSSTTSCTITKLKDMSATRVVIPDYVTSIGGFAGCSNITGITIPDNVKSINNYAFNNCTGLASITIPDGVTSIGAYAFSGCTELTSVTIGDSVTSIGQSAFKGCSGLTSITIPDSVTSIGRCVFSGCSSLESITIPFVGAKAGVTSSDTYQYPFGYIFGTSSYDGSVATTQYYHGSYTDSTTSSIYYISSSLKAVTVTGGNVLRGAFYNCSGLTNIKIPDRVTSIGENAFYHCISLTSITIPDSVTIIDDGAFRGCSGLTNITIPNGVTIIDSEVFRGCSGLTGVIIPNSVTSIGYSAFYDCSSLTSITIPDNLTSIDSYAFEGCSGLTSITIPNGVTSIGWNAFVDCRSLTVYYTGNVASWCSIGGLGNLMPYLSTLYIDGKIVEGELIIPDGVTSIGYSAFYGCSGLTSVIIPNSVTSIGSNSFNNCTGLVSITIPDSVTSIDGAAFYNCTGITSIIIPDSVTSIGGKAFSGCSGLTSALIKNGVTSIGTSVFSGCSSLESITIPFVGAKAGANYSFGYLFGRSKYDGGVETRQYYDENGRYQNTSCTYYIPSSLKSVTVTGGNVLRGAFQNCSGLTNITISDNATSIADDAFSGCSGLTSITIGSGVTSIGLNVFYNCTGLTTVNWNATACTSAGSKNYPIFNGRTNLTSVNIGNNVITIPSYAFDGCTGLTSVIIPDSVTSIGEDTFKGCSSLESITIPRAGVTSSSKYQYPLGYLFGTSSYTGGVATEQYYYGIYTSATYDTYYIPASLKSVTVSGGNIINGAFYGCTGLTSVTIGNGVKSIGYEAFSGCRGLKSVVIPDSVTSIGQEAFYNCTGLTSVTIGNGVKSIGHEAFRGCRGLKSVVIPDSVTSIGSNAFNNCTGLVSITIPDSVTSIDDYAFYGCTGLTSVTIGNSVKSIGLGAFKGCSSLKSITIPFVGASKTASKSYERVFGYIFGYETTTSSSSTVSGAINQYYDYWYYIPSSLKSVVISDGATAIPNYAFSGCTGLTSITIPDSVTSIGERAFYDCNGLTSITIPDSVTSIGERAFYDCNGLTSITIPDSVTSIGQSTFSGCIGLTSVTIPNSVTSIGSSAFYNCTGLRNVTIPDSVTSIGSSAFENCSRLTRIDFTGTIAQWNKISRGSKWDYGNPLYTICCTDGTINK